MCRGFYRFRPLAGHYNLIRIIKPIIDARQLWSFRNVDDEPLWTFNTGFLEIVFDYLSTHSGTIIRPPGP